MMAFVPLMSHTDGNAALVIMILHVCQHLAVLASCKLVPFRIALGM
jgi:hypothetical protein